MKASGSTVSLLRGVSQQVPQDRRPGQCTEQVNMLPDPVQGLTRRHGTRFIAERDTGLSPASFDAMVADTAAWRTFKYSNRGHDYVVLYRTAARPAGSTLPVLQVYDRTTASFLPLTKASDTQLDLLESGGVAALTSVGKYVFLAGNTTATTATSFNAWADADNANDAVVWIRGGAYSRQFTVVATRTDNTQVTFSYKTPTSSFPGVLDTRDVPIYALEGGVTTPASDSESAFIYQDGAEFKAELSWYGYAPSGLTAARAGTAMTNVHPATPTTELQYSYVAGERYVKFAAVNVGVPFITLTYDHWKTVPNPNYARFITDRTNAFNTAVTNWIGTAAEAIQPANIAEQLRLAAVAAGLTTTTRQASTLIFDNVIALAVNDGGDGTLIRGVANEVASVDQVSDIHKIGKVIKVRARGAAEAFYLRAVSKSQGFSTGYTEVTWVEGAGTVHTITNALLYLTVHNGTAYLASNAVALTGILSSDGVHPTYATSTVGDGDTSALPFFVGKRITYLGVFQDRLLIGAGAVIRASKVADYLNLFRSSVLTAPADDPLEMLSQGSEDDVLRFSVLYDRDLVIFADQRQYAVSGRSPLTPTSANMQVMSSHANAAQLPPLAVGGVIFYGQIGEKASALFQVQPGKVSESPESYIVSSQVDTYLKGSMIELANNPKPTHVFARTTGSRNSIYCFSYLDKEGEGRAQDAWHRLDFHPALGPVIGMSSTPAGLLVYYLRKMTDAGAVERVYLVADLMPLTAGLATYPYLDSIRTLALVNTGTYGLHPASTGDYRVAFDSTSEWQFVGTDLADQASLLAEFPAATGPQVGIDMPTEFTPTNPYVRDANDKAVTSGDLTVTLVIASLANSSGFTAEITSFGREATETSEYNARIVGDVDDIVGRETVTNIIQSIPIALETRDYKLTLRARTWLPFTVSTLEWVGQWFNRTRRL